METRLRSPALRPASILCPSVKTSEGEAGGSPQPEVQTTHTPLPPFPLPQRLGGLRDHPPAPSFSFLWSTGHRGSPFLGLL